jgi:hypothetical protein
MSNVVKFPGRISNPSRRVMTGEEFGAALDAMSPLERADLSAKLRRMADGISPADEPLPRWTGRQRAGRKKNPLRHPYEQMSLAVVAAGKLHRGEELRRGEHTDELKWLNRGIETARLLAQEFARLAKEHVPKGPQR